jgi:hypothetical protein
MDICTLNFNLAVRRCAAYLWASPNSLLGLTAGLLMLASGARVRSVQGVAEFHGGSIARLFAKLPHPYCFAAITFGHVILGCDPQQLDAARRHEHVHVRQYERWGPFLLPAYALSSLWQLLNGRRIYRDNVFEREAYAVDRDCPGP